ncbi:hypothetical protein ABDK00_000030 [Niabella insulamsoli]|uniref:hypothetical protein n=1 Tax=Niabella insulamsoli TaxID=3144874 RepID=UPI0031FE049D
MKHLIVLACLFLTGLLVVQAQPGSVAIIGTNHFPSKKFNADTLYNILEKLKPDIILLELDSALFANTFDSNFKLKYRSKETEPNAAAQYKQRYPQTVISYFEFENRDAYRKEQGIRQAQNII